MLEPLISVVLPCRLSGELGVEMRSALLELSLISLDAQDYPRDRMEVVIVDDGSDIGLADWIQARADRLPTLSPRVIRNDGPVHGTATAYNIGCAHARGRHVFLTTDDSLLAPDCLTAHAAALSRYDAPVYVTGVERQYLYGVLFRNIIEGTLHDREDLSVRTFGALLGVPDLRRFADYLGFSEWNVTPDDVRFGFDALSARSALTPNFRDMYEELASQRQDLRWLCVRVGNHSMPRDAYLALGGYDEDIPNMNSDQAFGLKLAEAGIDVVLERSARSVLLEHWRGLRGYVNGSGLKSLAARWPRPDVLRVHEFFAPGYDRSIAAYRRLLAETAR
ncbi:glycosyltransferase [Streptomyces xanthochromogenes]|uniref:glycosyltransferase n=1 Tax=Streptomyces xanthochromogenes TaxID=67384 RepID=UPI00341290A2